MCFFVVFFKTCNIFYFFFKLKFQLMLFSVCFYYFYHFISRFVLSPFFFFTSAGGGGKRVDHLSVAVPKAHPMHYQKVTWLNPFQLKLFFHLFHWEGTRGSYGSRGGRKKKKIGSRNNTFWKQNLKRLNSKNRFWKR